METRQPIPVIPLQYAEPGRNERPRWRAFARVATGAGWLACVAALGLIAAEVETVIATGPVIATVGSAMILGGGMARDRRVAVLGSAHCAVCVLFVVLVNFRGWDPGEAKLPFLVMGALYTAATAVPSYVAVFLRRDVVAQNERA